MNEKTKKVITFSAIAISIIGIAITITHACLTHPTSPELRDNAPSEHLSQQEQPPNKTSQNPPDDNPPSNRPDDFQPNNHREFENQNPLTIWHIVIIAIFCAIFSSSSVYLIMNWQSRNFHHNPDKLTIYILSNIILTATLTVIITLITNTFASSAQPFEDTSTKDKVTLDESHIANSDNINLSEQTSDITITKSGTYTFTGNTTHSILVNAPNQEVTLVLNNVNISNSQTAAIIGLSAKRITITSTDGSTNTLSDGGNSEYDGCIFSNAELLFNGNGTLDVTGQQNEGEGIATEAQNITFQSGTYHITSTDDGINAGGDGATITINGGNFYINASGDGIDSNKNAIINGGTIFVIGSDIGGDAGIDTDDGFTINGGTVIALGSDMIETPLQASQQKSIIFTLDNPISKDTIISLQKDNQEIISFSAPKSFKTIIISSNKLTDGTYSIYTNGTHSGKLSDGIYSAGTYQPGNLLKINNQTSFKLSGIVSTFGSNSHR